MLGAAAWAGCAQAAYSSPQFAAYRSFLPELEETARFAEMGIPLRTVFIANTISANGRPYCQYPMVWKQFREYDLSAVDRQLDDIIKASPKAEFMVFLDLNTPVWMTRRLYHDSFNEITHVLSIEKYRVEARDYLEKVVGHIEKVYGDRVKGYCILCGHTSEWFERNLRQSHVKNLAWRRWCAERGLRHGPDTPSESALAKGAFEGTMYDPATEREKIDFWKFHSWIIADGVLDFSRVVKRVSGGKPVGADYGYYMICGNTPCGHGELDYERVVASPDFDLLLSPATYTGRGPGGGVGSMVVPGTARRHGKRFYISIDFWPHSLKNEYGANYFRTIGDTLACNTRNAAFAIIHHADFDAFFRFARQNVKYASPHVPFFNYEILEEYELLSFLQFFEKSREFIFTARKICGLRLVIEREASAVVQVSAQIVRSRSVVFDSFCYTFGLRQSVHCQ